MVSFNNLQLTFNGSIGNGWVSHESALLFNIPQFTKIFFFLNFKDQGDGGLMEMIRPIILDFWSFCTMFVFCHFGEIMSTRFDEIDNAMSQNEWYLFPIRTQRVFPLVISVTQQPVVICGFGNLLLTHDSFKRVSVRWKSFLSSWTLAKYTIKYGITYSAIFE